jgi:hypothetical protein
VADVRAYRLAMAPTQVFGNIGGQSSRIPKCWPIICPDGDGVSRTSTVGRLRR